VIAGMHLVGHAVRVGQEDPPYRSQQLLRRRIRVVDPVGATVRAIPRLRLARTSQRSHVLQDRPRNRRKRWVAVEIGIAI
jgi:hypothetical protein